eukprot:3090414-Pyramimonas_sp.AAC.1
MTTPCSAGCVSSKWQTVGTGMSTLRCPVRCSRRTPSSWWAPPPPLVQVEVPSEKSLTPPAEALADVPGDPDTRSAASRSERER